MKPAVILLYFFVIAFSSAFGQGNQIRNMLELKGKPDYYEKLEILRTAPLTMKIEILYDKEHWSDEEYTYTLWMQVKDPPTRGKTKSYDVTMDSSHIQCVYYGIGAWGNFFRKDKYYSSGTVQLTQNPDSSFACILDIRIEDSASHREWIYKGSRKILNQNQYFLQSKGTWRTPLFNYTKLINNQNSDCPNGSVSFESDTSSWITAVFDGELVGTGQVNGSYYYAILRFGDFYLAYDHIKKLFVDNGYLFSRGYPIGQVYCNGEGNVTVTITLIKDGVSIPVFDWFRDLRPSVKKLIYTPLTVPKDQKIQKSKQ